MTASLEDYRTTETVDYKMLPKDIGKVPSRLLLHIARSYASRAERLDEEAATKLHATAGSAYIESMITDTSMSVDARLICLDKAEDHLRSAVDGERLLTDNGFYEFDDPTEWLRAQLNYDFINVYRDIACGEVTTLTVEEITEKLSRLKQVLGKTGKIGKAYTNERTINGLRGELVVLMKKWSEYAQGGDVIAFPSTVRGGNGEYRPGETHDIVFAWQNDAAGWEFSGAEVKIGGGRTIHALTRYKNTLIFVDDDETVRIFDPLPSTPDEA